MKTPEIINRVANSALITIDLEDYYPNGTRVVFDIKDWLYESLVLREKEFRAFVEAHDSGKECLEMNDCLGSIFAPVIKDNCVSQNFWLNVLGNPTSHFLATLSWLEEFSSQHLENHICCYSFGKQVIELRTNGSQLFWTLLRDHIFCDFSGVALILRTRHI